MHLILFIVALSALVFTERWADGIHDYFLAMQAVPLWIGGFFTAIDHPDVGLWFLAFSAAIGALFSAVQYYAHPKEGFSKPLLPGKKG